MSANLYKPDDIVKIKENLLECGDYQNNYTELPANVLKKVTQHHFSYCYCTEV